MTRQMRSSIRAASGPEQGLGLPSPPCPGLFPEHGVGSLLSMPRSPSITTCPEKRRPGHGGKGAHPLLWRETRAWRGREPQPVFWSTGSSDATSHLSCHHIPRLEQGRRRVITPPMTDPVMESELHNNFLCDCYILLSHSSS